ncbi:MAG: hypothetical protein LLF80_04525 [Porphyromonadaceae bacterium]|nr:hypothetical protein [Porphyromonadaceae bacterium]
MKSVKLFFLLCAFGAVSGNIRAQDVSVAARADIVSSYIWRGLYVGPASAQPSISLSAGDFRLGIWGSSSFEGAWREFDLYAGYFIGNFSVLVTDYFFPRDLPDGAGSSYFKLSEHLFEGTLGYSLGESLPLSLAWNTNFAGDDDYSSYFEAGYAIQAGDITLDLTLGATSWAGIYSDGFALINASIKASKEIAITDTFSLPVFTQAVLNPDTKDVFVVFGVSF